MNAAVAAGLDAGAAAHACPAPPRRAVQRAILDAVAEHGAVSSYWSGHGIGQDVIEEPWLGLDVVQDRDVPVGLDARGGDGARRSIPTSVDLENRGIGYMANTYVVRPAAARRSPAGRSTCT